MTNYEFAKDLINRQLSFMSDLSRMAQDTDYYKGQYDMAETTLTWLRDVAEDAHNAEFGKPLLDPEEYELCKNCGFGEWRHKQNRPYTCVKYEAESLVDSTPHRRNTASNESYDKASLNKTGVDNE